MTDYSKKSYTYLRNKLTIQNKHELERFTIVKSSFMNFIIKWIKTGYLIKREQKNDKKYIYI